MTADKLRILIVDDEEDIILISSLMLQPEGHVIDSAGDCASAVAKVKSNTYDVVLLDIGLPDGDGRDVLRQWKSEGLVPSMRVVIVSAYGFDIATHELTELGAAGYVRKPYTYSDLTRAVVAATGQESV